MNSLEALDSNGVQDSRNCFGQRLERGGDVGGRADRSTRTADVAAARPFGGAGGVLRLLLTCIAVVLLWSMPVAAQGPQTAALPGSTGVADAVLDARLGVHPDKTRFVLDLTRAVPFRVSNDASPWRVTVDLPDMAWSVRDMPAPRGMVSAIRREKGEPERVRLVLDTNGPSRIAWAAVIPPRDGKPPRFILDLVPVEARSFARDVRESGVLPVAAAAATAFVPPPALMPSAVPAAKPPAAGAAAATPLLVPAALSGMGAAVPVPRSKPRPPELPLIVIDAGHGGQDPGATAVNGVHEKDITLSVARELKRQLERTGRFRVALTRDRDVFIALRERVSIARSKGADLFISLHADSIGRREVRGLSVYTLSDKASDREAEMLAQRENRADAIVGLDLSVEEKEVVNILIDLAQRDTKNQSRRMAELVVREVGRDVELLPRPIRSAGFAVLTAPDVPSILVELGYLSHPTDAKLLTSRKHQERLAAGLVRAVDGFFKRDVLLTRS